MNRKLWRKSKVNHSSGFNIVSYFYVRDLGYIELHSVIQLYSFPRTLRNFHKCSGLKDQLFFPILKLREMSGIGRAILSPKYPCSVSFFVPDLGFSWPTSFATPWLIYALCYRSTIIYSTPSIYVYLSMLLCPNSPFLIKFVILGLWIMLIHLHRFVLMTLRPCLKISLYW